MRKLIVFFLVAINLTLILPIPMPGDLGNFNNLSGLYWCSTPLSCIHERGHELDAEHYYISQSAEFSRDLEIYIVVETKDEQPSKLSVKILEFPGIYAPANRIGWNARAEIYATIYADAGGNINNIPVIFQKYYR